MVVFWGSFAAFFVDPFYGIVHYSLINILRPEQLLWGGGVGRIYLGAQAAIFVAWLVNRKKLTPEYTAASIQIKAMVAFAFGMTIATIFAIAPKDLSWFWTSAFYKTVLFCYMMTKCVNKAKKLDLYYAPFLVWFMLLQVWGIQQKLGGNVRMEGIGGDQLSNVNDLSSVAVMYFPMAYYALYNTKRWIRLCVGIPATIVSVIFILFGGSRGAFLGLAACVLYIGLRTPGLQKIKMLLTASIVGTLLFITISAVAPEGFFDEYKERLATMLGEEDADTGDVEYEASAAGRIAMWKAVYHFMRQHPEFWLTGVGMKGFSEIYYNYLHEIEPYLTPEENVSVAYRGIGGKAIHNTYLNVLSGGGLLSFLPWVFLLFVSWFQASRIPKKYPKIVDGVNIHNYAQAIEAGLVGIFVTIMFGNTESVDFYYWHMTMVGVLVNIGKARLQREELGIEDEEWMEESVARVGYSSAHF
jgi:O-antigen ligase